MVAQDLTAYGHDLPGRPRLHDLLTALCEVDIRWLRLHYAYPRDFPDALVKVIAEQPKVAKYLDMPLQHINDRVLKRMQRRVNRAATEELRDNIKEQPLTAIALVAGAAFLLGFLARRN